MARELSRLMRSSCMMMLIIAAIVYSAFPTSPAFLSLIIIPFILVLRYVDQNTSTTVIAGGILVSGIYCGYFTGRNIVMLACGTAIAILMLSIILDRKANLSPYKIYKNIFDTIIDMIVIVETDTRKIYLANEQACQVLGYTEEEICNITIDKIHPPESWEFITRIFEKGIRDEINHAKDIPVKPKNGKLFYADVSGKRITLSDREMLLGVFRDITERKNIEDELKQIKFIIDSTSDAIGMATAEGVHFYQNKAFNNMFGFTVEEVAKRHPTAAFNDKETGKEVFETIQAGNSWHGEVQMTAKDGRSFPVFLKADAVKYEDGKVAAVIGVHTDISERKRTEKEKARLELMLAHSQKMESIGRLAGGVAHDFNNLLTAILGNTEIGMQTLSPDDKLYQRFATIKKAAESAAEITRQLLAFSRKQIVKPQIIDLNELIKQLIRVLTPLIGENISLEINTGKDLHAIELDPVNIEQIIINLATNARDAMPDNGKIIFETANVELDEAYCATHAGVSPGKYVRLTISDTGDGMDEEIMKHLYEPFFTTKEKDVGTGLGLATVYGIVNQNGGLIEVYSELKKGTTFKIYFPAIIREGTPLQLQGSEKTLPKGNETILLVEDNADVLAFAMDSLGQLGYNVIAATSGEEAVTIASHHKDPIDLLLTDVILPGMNGRKTAETIAVERPSIKVIFISGYTAEVIDKHGMRDQGLNFIGKPFAIQTLSKKIREILDESSS